MTTCKRGDVVVVSVVFTGQSGHKHRPALVVSTERVHRKLLDVILCPISSQPRFYSKPGAGDHPLKHWKAIGLRHPSTVRISNIVAAPKTLIRRVLGSVHADDLASVENGLRKAFEL
jgi:mRNA-degrading endonuclease toxin of MazEF toxin-antitoxin module